MFDNSTILITGGTGSWGRCLTSVLDGTGPKEIRIFSRGELAQVEMQRDFADYALLENSANIRYIIGDVRDYEAVERAMRGVDYVFHLAALKHVPICEENVQEAIKTNITGTTNIVNAALANNVKKVIDVSTDKAVAPTNLYGMTKAVGEKIIIQANDLGDTEFVCVRGGNVLGSNGSVVPFFIRQATEEEDITVTDKRMTRFFITLPEAIQLLITASRESLGGETFVMNMPACTIHNVAEVIQHHHDEDNKCTIKEVGIRQGEKLHEVLISSDEAVNTYVYDENYYVITNKPMHHLQKYAGTEFASNTKILNWQETEELLDEGGWLCTREIY